MKTIKKFMQSFILAITLLFGTAFFTACGEVNVTAITINDGPQMFEVGDEFTFTATLTPSKATNKDITWTSSNTAVASINENGKAVAKSSGSTIITAMSKKNSNVKDTYTLVVFGEGNGVVMLSATYTYDGEQKPYVATYVPDGLDLRYTYKSASYPESEFAPKDADTYTVTAYNRISGSIISTTTLTIKKKYANISIGNYTKKYSEPDPTFTASVTGLVGEDTIEYTIERLAGENVENYKIYPVVTPHKNYEPIISEGRLTIEQLPVKIIVDNKTSTYGEVLQNTTYTLQSLDNMLLDDVLKTQIQGSPIIEKPAGIARLEQGSYSITASNLTSSNLNILSTQNGTYTVNKKIVTIAIAEGQFKYAGQPEPALKYAIDGTLEGDDLSGCLSRVHGETVGFYEYNIDQGINANYIIMTEAGATAYKFEIRSNTVSIAFNTFEINYSQTNKEAYIPSDCYNYTITVNDNPITYNVDNLGNIYINDTDSVALSHEVTKEAHMSDEEKEVFYQKWKVVPSKASSSGYSDPAKYNFTFVEGFKYLKLLNLNVYANETYKIYGEVDPALTFSADGFLEGDDIDSVLKTVTLKRATGEDVTGTGYVISLQGNIELYDTKSYYKPIFTENVFVIEKRELRVQPISYTEENPIYYGEAPRVLEIDDEDLNLATRDNLNTVLAGELYRANNEDVGQYPILGTNLELISDNYYLTFTPGVYTIVPRPIQITAINKTIQYGEAVSRYQYSYSIIDEFTFVDEEGEEQTELRFYTINAPTFTGSLALTTYGLLYANNTYTIGQGNLTAGGNFEVTFTPGTLTVVPREVTLAFTPQSYGFTEYNALSTMQSKIDALVYSFKPALAYSDMCAIKYIGLTSQAESSIISLNKDADGETYIITLEFTSHTGTILEDCYNVTIDQNYVELFYLGQSLLDISIDSLTQTGTQIVEKTYGDKYLIKDVFKITALSAEYTIEYTNEAFNIKGITDQAAQTTPSSTVFPAGSYTVTVFKNQIVIKDSHGEDVSTNFALNIKNYGSLVVNKANLDIVQAPTISSIVYGTQRPTFIGGTYQFVNGDGTPITINGIDEEYSTSSTATYAVQSTAHLIMATFTPRDKNFNSLTINNLALVVTKQMIDTTVLEWSYGASVENLGTEEDNVYTTYTNIAVEPGEQRNVYYDGAYTEENTYNIPTNLANYRFLRQTLGMQNRYFGVSFHDEDGGDTGFMYYIESNTVKKVFPADSNNFYVVLDKSTAGSFPDVEFYYNDGTKDYLLTNSSDYGDGKPVYWESVYSPKESGVYLARTIISSLNSNYAVFEDGDPATTEETITYYNAFMVEKVIVKVYNFTSKITYHSPLEFFYVTNPEEIYGVTSTFWDRDAASTHYTERATAPVNVGNYAVTFLIDQANYYYYNEHCDFAIVPIEINVLWNEVSSFDYISTTTSITRNYKVFAGPALTAGGEEITANLVYDSANPESVAPEWLHIIYHGTMKNGTPYFDEGKIADVAIPCNAGTYTIEISIETGSENYTGSASETYEIKPIFYNGSIGIIRYTMTYDVAYNEGATGAQKFYNMLVFGKQEPVDGDNSGMITNAAYGSDAWTNYYLTISYLSNIIDPTGTDTAAVTTLNKAGGPYKITLSIKSKDGNIKETLKTANLTVNKTNVPTMAAYPSDESKISFTGDYVFNGLTTIDKSLLFNPDPASYDSTTMTYSYEHNGDRDIYFGIDYQYFLVRGTEETTGVPCQAPITPRDDGFIYMVKAFITTGANYNAPAQTEYTGYFSVQKTYATLTAENVEVVYSGQRITIPDVVAKNGDQQPLNIKYEDVAGVGLYVSIKIVNEANGKTVSYITNAGTYKVTYTLEDTDFFLSEGSTFSTTCTILVNKKPIDGLESFVEKPDTFVSTEIYKTFYINGANAYKYNNAFANSQTADVSGTSFYIQLFVTNKTDGTGTIIALTGKNDASIRDLAAGTYYYFVDVKSTITGKSVNNYTRSEYIEFTVVRKDVEVTFKPGFESGVTINYTAGSQGYDVANLNVNKVGTTSYITGLTQKDFEIEYKGSGDTEYQSTPPVTNGIYDVKIRCFNGNYQSDYVYTTLTIDAPLLEISGNLNYTYGFVNELNLSLTATGGDRVHTITFDGVSNKYNEEALKNEKGRWFLIRDNFGVMTAGAAIPNDFALDDGRVIGEYINNGLAGLSTPMYTALELLALPAGIHKMTIVYVSNDTNFAITFAELLFTVEAYEIASDAFVGSDDPNINYNADNKTFSQNGTETAVSKYSEDTWSFESKELNETIIFEVSVKIKNPNDADYTNSTIKKINLVATVSGVIDSSAILAAFGGDLSATTTSPIQTFASSISFDTENYKLSDDLLAFALNIVFNKQTTDVFTEKKTGNELDVIEYSYGDVFLDEYWANIFKDDLRASFDHPNDFVDNASHIYLYNLINLPAGNDIDKFRSAWNYGSESTRFNFYSINAYAYNNNVKGAQQNPNHLYNSDDNIRAAEDISLYHFYKYDLDPDTNAGLYLLEITLNSSDYFLATTLTALVRIKPTTFYARTTLGNGNGLIDVATTTGETVKVYNSKSSSATAAGQGYTIQYFPSQTATTPAYASKYSGGASGTYTPITSYSFRSYSEMISSVEGAQNFKVHIIPEDANSMYVEDIQILVVNGTINIGTFNIYDELNIYNLSQVDGSILNVLYEMSKGGEEGLSWMPMLETAFANSGKTLTENAISIMRFADQSKTPIDKIDNKYTITITPDSNNQYVIDKMPLMINFEDGSKISVMVGLVINLKLSSSVDIVNFEYNGNTQTPTVTAYFQGWTSTIPFVGESPNVNNMTIIENMGPVYTGSKTTKYIDQATGSVSNTAPTNAGNYIIRTIYAVSFPNASDPSNPIVKEFICDNNFAISKIEAEITMESMEFLWDDQIHTLTATTTIPGLTATIVYTASDATTTTDPRNADVYYAVATIDDINYFGTAVAMLTITATSTRIEIIMPSDYTYTGSAITPTIKVYNANNVDITNVTKVKQKTTITWNGTANQSVNAGAYEYKVVIAGTSSFLSSEAVANYVIHKAAPTITITDPANLTYTGSEIKPTINISNSLMSYTEITYNGSETVPTEAGIYEVYINCNPPEASNYLAVTASYTYRILPQALQVTYASTGTLFMTYSEGMKLDTLRPTPSAGANVKYTYQGFEYNDDGTLSNTLLELTEFPTNAGVYTIIATPQSTNFTGRVSTTLIISRIIPSVTFNVPASMVYNSNPQAPTVGSGLSGLTYTTTYVGTDNDGNEYNSAIAPTNAGNYDIIVTFAGNKNYCAVTGSQNFIISRQNTITLKFDQLSLSLEYNGSPQTPVAKAYAGENEATALNTSVLLLFGESSTPPVDAGTYIVKAILVNCNYSAEVVQETFRIYPYEDDVIELTNGGILDIGATSIGSINVNGENYEIHYIGKTYLANGELSPTNNYEGFLIPGVPGEYVATLISSNYKPTQYAFTIRKKDVSSSMVLTNYNVTAGTLPILNEKITIGPDTYTVKYLYKAETGTEFTETMPKNIGQHQIKMIVYDAIACGEKVADFVISSTNPASNKVVVESLYYMYTGNDIVVNAQLYLGGILQTGDIAKTFTYNGESVSHVNQVGEYVVTLTATNGSHESATFTVIPNISLSTPTDGDVYSGSTKTVTYQFTSSTDQSLYGADTALVIMRDGYTVGEVRDAGEYAISVCYKGYPVITRNITINKKNVTEEIRSQISDISMVYGEPNKPQDYIGSYKVKYLININGNNTYQEITPPVGNHLIKFIVDSKNHSGEVIVNLSVAKKTILLDMDDMTIEYSGNTIVLPNNIGSLENLSYEYSPTDSNYIVGLPTDVGTYYVRASSLSENYDVRYRDNSRKYILVTITKATPTYVVSNLTQLYDGSAKTPLATAMFNGRIYDVNVSNSNMINAGEYTVYFSMADNTSNFNQSSNYTFTIEQAEVDITYTIPDNMIYDGTQKLITPTASIADVGSVQTSIVKDGRSEAPIAAGIYTATFTTVATTNYKSCTKVVVFEILPAKTEVTCTVDGYSYSGGTKPVSVATVPVDTTKVITYTGINNDGVEYNSTTAPIDAGSYIAHIVVTPTDTNYSIETIDFTYTIVKVVDTIVYSGAGTGYFYYDGSKKSITITSSGSGTHNAVAYKKLVNGSYVSINENEVKDEGSYRAILTTEGNKNYYPATQIVNFSIYKERLYSNISNKTVEYSGSPQHITPDNTHGGKVEVVYRGKTYNNAGKLAINYPTSGTETTDAPTAAGIYTAVVRAKDSKYAIEGISTATLVIKRTQLEVSINIAGVSATSTIVDYTGAEYNVSATTVINGITKDIVSDNIATNSLMIKLIGTNTNVPLQNGGAYEIIVDINNANYIGHAERLITVRPQAAAIFATQTASEYTAKRNDIKFIVVSKTGDDITALVQDQIRIEYYDSDDNSVDPINVGTYRANIILANSSYVANASYTYFITETTPTLEYRHDETFTNLSMTDSLGFESFNTSTYSVKLNGEILSPAEYEAKIYKLTFETDDDGNIEEAWSLVSFAAGSTITNIGSYKIVISISNTGTYQDNLIGTTVVNGNVTTEDVLVWEYLFYLADVI